MTPLLAVESLRHAYRGAVAVADMSFVVHPGEAVAVLGANGAGKSTTMKVVAGALPCQGGRIRFDGEDITALASHGVVERGITLVPEGRLVFPRMSVAENLRMGAHAKRAHAGYARNLARVLDIFPRLAERRAQMAGLMSGGEQQMLAIARGMMSDPRLMILDEPSLGLMPTMVEALFALMARIREAGVSLVLVEQNVYQSLQLADRAYVMEKGRVTRGGTGQALLADDFVRRAFLGQ